MKKRSLAVSAPLILPIALGTQYEIRRNHLIDSIGEEFDLSSSYAHQGIWRGTNYYTATPKAKQMSEKFGNKPMFSFVAPTAGMFLWVKIHLENCPRQLRGDEDELPLEVQLWAAIAEAGVLLGPGWIFSTDTVTGGPIFSEHGHFRIAFSDAQVSILTSR